MGACLACAGDYDHCARRAVSAVSPLGDAAGADLPHVWQSGIAIRDVAVRLRLLLSGSFIARLSGLQNVTAGSALLPLQHYAEGAAMRMRVTERDQKLLAGLAAARWLTTQQVKSLCFPEVTIEMARRRLRLLASESFVHSWRVNRMAEALHSLGANGRRLLVASGWAEEIRLERKPPKNLEHFLGINEIRIAIERSAQSEGIELGFFFAYWELLQQGWAFRIIPDAACQFTCRGKEMTLLFEYDRGEEAPGYIIRTKFKPYAQGLDGFPFSRVLMVVETERRLTQLRKYTEQHLPLDRDKFFFITREVLSRSWSLASLLS